MRFLLDTSVFIWLEQETDRLKPNALAMLRDRANEIWVSVATIWEISIKQQKKALNFSDSPLAAARLRDYKILVITAEHAEAAVALPRHHRDPFDRLLIAQARLEGLTLVTDDAMIKRYSVTVL